MHVPQLLLPETMTLVWTLIEDASPLRFGAAVYAVFTLNSGDAEPKENPEKRLAPADDFWPLMAKGLGKIAVVDSGMPKPRGEYLVYGSCHVPQPVQASQVRVAVAGLEKTLSVYGPRRWGKTGIERYGSFSRMPIDFFHAFGGPGFKANPFGMGHKSTQNPLLPHVEDPRRQIGLPSDEPQPAGFFALPAYWPQRAEMLGRFDTRWLHERWPHLPEDTRPEYRNSAMPDQWLDGFFTGDEELRIENMHPERQVMESSLPGLRGRLFMQRRAETEENNIEEVELRPETLWLFPEFERGVLLHRGSFACDDDELADIELFYGAWEPLGHAPLSIEQHRERLEVRRAPAIEAQQPEPAAAAAEDAPKDAPEDEKGQAKKAAQAAALAPASESHAAVDDPTGIEAELAGVQDTTERALEEAGLSSEQRQELFESMEQADLETEQEQLQNIQGQEAQVHQFMLESGKSPEEIAGMDEVQKLEMGTLWLQQRTREIALEQGMDPALLDETMNSTDFAALEEPGQEQALKALEDLENTVNQLRADGLDTADFEEAVGGIRAMYGEMGLMALPAAAAPLDVSASPEEGASEETAPAVAGPRERVLQLQSQGKRLVDKDFSKADLSGLDFSGCDCSRSNFKGADLTNCNFSQAILDRANLSQCVLDGADCSRASLCDATLHQATGSEFKAQGACFSGAGLNGAHFLEAVFDSADFGQSRLRGAMFENCSMQQVDFAKAKLHYTSFQGSNLSGGGFDHADIKGASLEDCALHSARLTHVKASNLRLEGAVGAVDCSKADLRNSRADETTCLDKSVFEKADLRGCCWTGASLRQCRFESALLQQADLGKTDLFRASMRHCRMQGVDLSKAKLHETDCTRSDLLQARLRRAELVRTDFTSANLFAVDFFKAMLNSPVLRQTNLKRTLIKNVLP